MNTRDDKTDDLLRGWLSHTWVEKAPEGFTRSLMEKVHRLDVSPRPSFLSWLKEYMYYIMAVVFLGSLGFYFSGPYNFSLGQDGIGWQILDLISAWIPSLGQSSVHWGFLLQGSTVAGVVILTLLSFVILDHLINKRLKAQY